MIGVLLETSGLILLMMGFRILCRHLISAKWMYRLWLLVVICMIPVGGISGRESFLLNLFSKGMELLPNSNFVRFDPRAVRIPWYLTTVWIVGSVLVFLWEFHVNFKFEKMLFESRVRLSAPDCSYPVYEVSGLRSSCVFRVKREAGIYLGKEVLEDPNLYETILAHEACHLKAGDLFWGRVRLFLLAIYWFHPLVWIAAVLSKEDCEMACDERAVAQLMTKKTYYGKALLDAVNTETSRMKESVFCIATTMISSERSLKIRIKRLVAKECSWYIKVLTGGIFALFCIILCSFGTMDLQGMNGEETIRQYVYYSNAGCQSRMEQLCLDGTWDQSLSWWMDGEILEIRKSDAKMDELDGRYYEQEAYQVKMRRYDEDTDTARYEEETVLLVKQTEQDDWKIVWWIDLGKG